ncbi:MAG: hypothetical protein PHF26_01380, partial [Candidatus Gracilibacteria bacterium]|nr:hypothetical protein [Candidatus Gracilibacteria bacterium]
SIDDIKAILFNGGKDSAGKQIINFETVYFKCGVCTNDSYGILFENVVLDSQVQLPNLNIKESKTANIDIEEQRPRGHSGGGGGPGPGTISTQPGYDSSSTSGVTNANSNDGTQGADTGSSGGGSSNSAGI